MTYYANDTRKAYDITLRVWEHGNWSPDVYADLAAGDTATQEAYNYTYCCAVLPQQTIDDIVAWWRDEVESVNAAISAGEEYNGDGIAYLPYPGADPEATWCLDVDELAPEHLGIDHDDLIAND